MVQRHTGPGYGRDQITRTGGDASYNHPPTVLNDSGTAAQRNFSGAVRTEVISLDKVRAWRWSCDRAQVKLGVTRNQIARLGCGSPDGVAAVAEVAAETAHALGIAVGGRARVVHSKEIAFNKAEAAAG